MRTEKDPLETLPCRMIIRFDGLEYFIYNRSEVYDDLEKIVNRESTAQANSNDYELNG